MTIINNLNQQELINILAGLRLLQNNLDNEAILPHFDDSETLSTEQIDDLCNKINTPSSLNSDTPSYIIQVEGGLIQNVFCHAQVGSKADFYIFDRDTEGADKDDLFYVSSSDGKLIEGFISHIPISPNPQISLKDVVKKSALDISQTK